MQARRCLDAGYRRLVFGGRGRPLAAARRTPLEVVEKLLTSHLDGTDRQERDAAMLLATTRPSLVNRGLGRTTHSPGNERDGNQAALASSNEFFTALLNGVFAPMIRRDADTEPRRVQHKRTAKAHGSTDPLRFQLHVRSRPKPALVPQFHAVLGAAKGPPGDGSGESSRPREPSHSRLGDALDLAFAVPPVGLLDGERFPGLQQQHRDLLTRSRRLAKIHRHATPEHGIVEVGRATLDIKGSRDPLHRGPIGGLPSTGLLSASHASPGLNDRTERS